MNQPAYFKLLAAAFHDLHACEAVHFETVSISEQFRGQTVFEGEVEVFTLTGHPAAMKGYAWSYDEGGSHKIAAVLEIAPIIGPKKAVQASILAGFRNRA